MDGLLTKNARTSHQTCRMMTISYEEKVSGAHVGNLLPSPLSRGDLLDQVCSWYVGHSSISTPSETRSSPFSKSKVYLSPISTGLESYSFCITFIYFAYIECLVYISVLRLTDELCWNVENGLWLQCTPHSFWSLPFKMPEGFIT